MAASLQAAYNGLAKGQCNSGEAVISRRNQRLELQFASHWSLHLAERSTRLNAAVDRPWPDAVDSTALLAFCGVAFGLPILGYVIMVGDIRRYLRSLRRALVVLTRSVSSASPYWVKQSRPPCLETLGLTLPCTEEQVLAAYRRKVKEMHPDKGGSLQKFLQLQRHFEQALYLARSQAKVSTVSVK